MMLLFASRETHGNQGRADTLSSDTHFHLPCFFDTYKKKQYLSSSGLTGTSQAKLVPPSQCQKLGKVNRAGEEMRIKGKEVKEGRLDGEERRVCEDERGLSLHHNDSELFFLPSEANT